MANWHVLGLGSLGSLCALRLLNAGQTVAVLPAAPAHTVSRTVHRAGQPAVTITLPCIGNEPVVHLVLAVKAPHTCSALLPWLQRLDAGATLICLQNGFGSLDNLALPAQLRVLHAVSTDGVWRDADQIHVAAENDTLIGDAGAAPDWLASVQRGWPQLHWCEDIELARWRKLAVNAVINPLTALYRCRNGALLDGAERQLAMQQLASEVDLLARQLFPDWPCDTASRSAEIARQTAANTSSMLADVLAGRRTEIDYINGYLLRHAQRLGIALPAHADIYQRIGHYGD